MAEPIRPEVNRRIFSWAIARAGEEERDVCAVYPQFSVWQTGEKRATVKQLKDFSNRYNFPFGYFFLKNIPEPKTFEIPFFRSANVQGSAENENVNETVKLLKERQEWLSAYLRDSGAEHNPLVGAYEQTSNVDAILQGIRKIFSLSDDWNLKLKTAEDALKLLKDKLEDCTVVVSFNSVVNNNGHKPIPVRLCRGFCLIDDIAPFIFVNSADSKKAQVFTLLHELAHILISFSAGFGECGTEYFENAKETLCDAVAANLLVPEDLLQLYAQKMSNAELSELFKASELVILRRKLDSSLISKDEFFAAYNKLPAYKKTGGGGGNFYLTAQKRIGIKLLTALNNALQERVITPLEAYRLAGIRGDTFTKITARDFV